MAPGGQVPPVELECPVVGCTLGENGGTWKTPSLPSGETLQLLTLHHHNHAQTQGNAVGQQRQVGCKAEKVPRPVLKKGQSEDKFLHFNRQTIHLAPQRLSSPDMDCKIY